MRCDFLVGSLLPNLPMMDYCDHGQIYNIHLISNIISSEHKRSPRMQAEEIWPIELHAPRLQHRGKTQLALSFQDVFSYMTKEIT
jgi:hypothetical protein